MTSKFGTISVITDKLMFGTDNLSSSPIDHLFAPHSGPAPGTATTHVGDKYYAGEIVEDLIAPGGFQPSGKSNSFRSYFGGGAAPFCSKSEVKTEELSANLTTLLKSMDGVLSSLPDRVGDFRLESMTLDVEISGEGSVSLLGTGGKLGGKGGLSLVLKRNEAPKPATVPAAPDAMDEHRS